MDVMWCCASGTQTCQARKHRIARSVADCVRRVNLDSWGAQGPFIPPSPVAKQRGRELALSRSQTRSPNFWRPRTTAGWLARFALLRDALAPTAPRNRMHCTHYHEASFCLALPTPIMVDILAIRNDASFGDEAVTKCAKPRPRHERATHAH